MAQHYDFTYLAGDAVVPRREAAEVRDGGVRGEGGRLPACEYKCQMINEISIHLSNVILHRTTS